MIEEEGVVVGISGGNATVEILRKSACESCAAAGICHPRDANKSFMEAANPLRAVPGQKVRVELKPQSYLQMAIVLYGVPLAALVTGAIVAKNLSLYTSGGEHSDRWAFYTGIVCMIVSFVSIRLYAKKVMKKPQYKPVIREILSEREFRP